MHVLSLIALSCVLASAALPAAASRQGLASCQSQHEQPVVESSCAPWFCHGLDCPAFNRTKVKDGWEEREYEKAQWVWTAVDHLPLYRALPIAFWRFLANTKGANLEETQLEMTAPVVTLFQPKYGFRESKKNYTVALFLPKRDKEPPVPRDRALVVRSTPSGKVFVRSFSGFATEQAILDAAARLVDALEGVGQEVDKGQFYFASYDPPFRLFNRHNEVWMLPKDKETVGSMLEMQLSLA